MTIKTKYESSFGRIWSLFLNMKLCVLFLVIGFRYGSSQEESSSVIPGSSPTFVNSVDTTLATNSEAGSQLVTLLEQLFKDDNDVSPYVDAIEYAINSFFDNNTAAVIGQVLSTMLQDPEGIKNFLNNNGGAVFQFAKVFLKNVTDDTSEVRQQILKDIILAGLRSLSTEEGQTFVKGVMKNIISSMFSNGGNPANIMKMAMSYAGIGNSAGGASSALTSLIGNNPLLSLLTNAEGSSVSSDTAVIDNSAMTS